VEQDPDNSSCNDPSEYLYPKGSVPKLAASESVFVEPDNPSDDDNNDGFTNLEETLYQISVHLGGS
jgi:hypothetical protein